MTAVAKTRSVSDCFPAQNRPRKSKALRWQRQWECRQRALFAQFRTKRDRSRAADGDLAATIQRETRGRLLYRQHYGGRCLRAQFSIRRSYRKFLPREFRRSLRNRSAPFAVFPGAK